MPVEAGAERLASIMATRPSIWESMVFRVWNCEDIEAIGETVDGDTPGVVVDGGI